MNKMTMEPAQQKKFIISDKQIDNAICLLHKLYYKQQGLDVEVIIRKEKDNGRQ